MPRKKAARYVTLFCTLLGVLSALSFGVLADVKIFGLTFFEFLDTITSKVMLPLGGMLVSIFVGWYLDRRIVWDEISNEGSLKVSFFKVYIFILRYLAPIAIALIFIKEMGLW